MQRGLDQADRLDAAGHKDGHLIDKHALGRDTDGLQAGGTAAVDSGSSHRNRQASADRTEASDVVARIAFRSSTSHDHVLDLSRIKPCALDGVSDRVATQGGPVGLVERPSKGLGKRSPGR